MAIAWWPGALAAAALFEAFFLLFLLSSLLSPFELEPVVGPAALDFLVDEKWRLPVTAAEAALPEGAVDPVTDADFIMDPEAVTGAELAAADDGFDLGAAAGRGSSINDDKRKLGKKNNDTHNGGGGDFFLTSQRERLRRTRAVKVELTRVRPAVGG